jgi:hypothetical protein
MLLGVKLWIVFWSILSRFNEFRYKLEDVGSGPDNGIGDQSYIFPALAAMYLLTPMLSFAAVSLLSAATGAAGMFISDFLGLSGNSGIPGMFWSQGLGNAMSDGGSPAGVGQSAGPPAASASAQAGTSDPVLAMGPGAAQAPLTSGATGAVLGGAAL